MNRGLKIIESVGPVVLLGLTFVAIVCIFWYYMEETQEQYETAMRFILRTSVPIDVPMEENK